MEALYPGLWKKEGRRFTRANSIVFRIVFGIHVWNSAIILL